MDGIELLTRLKQVQPDLPVILVTADGSISAAVEAVKRGAMQYLTKPCEVGELRRAVMEAAASRNNVERPLRPKLSPARTEELIGTSAVMGKLRADIELLGPASSPVLVLGETGTGKEVVARALHACSPRHGKPFVTVNTSAIPEALLESEMFGHVRGAFTGATQSHRGMFVEADGGTLLLDEIGDMPQGLQAKLLRVVQSGELRAVGADRVTRVDVRIIAATHRRLTELVREGRFREDLYYRLNVVTIAVPPLRDRASDIPELAAAFLARAVAKQHTSFARRLRSDVIDLLLAHSWPGNIRELESTIERVVVLCRDEEVEPRHVAWIGADGAPPSGASTSAPVLDDDLAPVDSVIRRHVDAVLAHTGGNKTRAAKILGVDLSTLYRWMNKWQGTTATGK
jgi:two-component system response regulator HydG